MSSILSVLCMYLLYVFVFVTYWSNRRSAKKKKISGIAEIIGDVFYHS